MKLPETKQERIKLFAVIALGAALVILGISHGVVTPLRKAHASRLARLAEQQKAIDDAQRQIRAAANSYERRLTTIAKVKEISDLHVMQPVLGNYLLGASPAVEAIARAAGIEIDPVREVGISEIPGQGDRNVKAYNLRITTRCSYHELVRFLREVEGRNPFATITSLSIQGQARDPEHHSVTIEMQLPVWTDPSMPEQLQEQMEEKRDGYKADGPEKAKAKEVAA